MGYKTKILLKINRKWKERRKSDAVNTKLNIKHVC